jgi:hypothetical protein
MKTGGNRNRTLRFGTWNITSLTGKEIEIAEEILHIPVHVGSHGIEFSTICQHFQWTTEIQWLNLEL